ncbi:hypothetical protein [Actinomadura parmotrematis]|uniref:Uncharacterized protein n=1 Tax=Actinomadura parmotrematis TaxID=2864039 RepID=A0ABS7G1G3_9ACTN|nr:hypothetical protein [Actinomadura parmotrematis]MBW8486547.1 hypothetical protein [Actinomadura parmotrematis]
MGTATARMRRRGPAVLLVALFAVAGLLAGYGLEHGAPPKVCAAHLAHGGDADVIVGGGPAAAGPALSAPDPHPPLSPGDSCLGLAILLTLLVLALACRPGRAGARFPARTGWTLALPPPPAPPRPDLSSLQVLRL